jgi:CheY-like chemotaxis protein
MDIHMPIMDGLAATQRILELYRGGKPGKGGLPAGDSPPPPIVAITANIMSDDLKMYKSQGMSDCIGKPFTAQELWRILAKYLKVVDTSDIDRRQHSRDNELLLRNLSVSFIKNNQDVFAQFSRALTDDDVESAHRIVHTLKSNAGQIGKKQLQEAAAAVEEGLKSGKNLISKKQLDLLGLRLRETLEEMSHLLQSAQFTQTADKESIGQILQKLEQMLINKNPECEDLLDEINTIPNSEALVDYVDNFKFNSAISELEKIKKDWGIK